MDDDEDGVAYRLKALEVVICDVFLPISPRSRAYRRWFLGKCQPNPSLDQSGEVRRSQPQGQRQQSNRFLYLQGGDKIEEATRPEPRGELAQCMRTTSR